MEAWVKVVATEMESSNSRFERRVELVCGKWVLSSLMDWKDKLSPAEMGQAVGRAGWEGGEVRIQALCILCALCVVVSHPRGLSRRQLGIRA